MSLKKVECSFSIKASKTTQKKISKKKALLHQYLAPLDYPDQKRKWKRLFYFKNYFKTYKKEFLEYAKVFLKIIMALKNNS